MSFSPEWLALREPADHAARSQGLLREVSKRFVSTNPITIVDLGCGAGSNLRGSYRAFGPRQFWTLVDYDPVLLDAARARLTAWADKAVTTGDRLTVTKDGRELTITFQQADLNRDLDVILSHKPDLVTAAALFDLVSPHWITRFVQVLAARDLPLYTVLTYDGTEKWTPPHAADAAIHTAFKTHQGRDKGFGPAAGPEATRLLVEGFRKAGFVPMTAGSPWVLAREYRVLCAELARGTIGAVRETGMVSERDMTSWLEARLEGATCVVGHQDLFATTN